MKRALEAHMTTVQALYDLYVKEFFLQHPNLQWPRTQATQQLDQTCVLAGWTRREENNARLKNELRSSMNPMTYDSKDLTNIITKIICQARYKGKGTYLFAISTSTSPNTNWIAYSKKEKDLDKKVFTLNGKVVKTDSVNCYFQVNKCF